MAKGWLKAGICQHYFTSMACLLQILQEIAIVFKSTWGCLLCIMPRTWMLLKRPSHQDRGRPLKNVVGQLSYTA
jgi:hypothetical protein